MGGSSCMVPERTLQHPFTMCAGARSVGRCAAKNQADRMLSEAGLVPTPSKGVKPGAGWRG